METENIDQNEMPTFTLKKWNAVAVWSWSTNIENCAICKLYLSELCPSCTTTDLDQENTKKCIPIWGECTHPYHEHCIESWIKQSNTCPLCSKPWEVRKSEPPQTNE